MQESKKERLYCFIGDFHEDCIPTNQIYFIFLFTLFKLGIYLIVIFSFIILEIFIIDLICKR
jgi:hypothetical protein